MSARCAPVPRDTRGSLRTRPNPYDGGMSFLRRRSAATPTGPDFDVLAMDPGGAAFGVWQAKNHTGSQLANEPGAFAWVWASLYDATVTAHRHFGDPLSQAQAGQLWDEWRRLGRLLGVREFCLAIPSSTADACCGREPGTAIPTVAPST